MKILVTSGGTKIKIDRVRSITNMSKGTFGSAIAKEFLLKGHKVDFLMAEGSKSPFEFRFDYKSDKNHIYSQMEYLKFLEFCEKHDDKFRAIKYKTFDEYAGCLEFALHKEDYHIIVLAAAVSDYDVANYVDGKIRSTSDLSIRLKALPKLIGTIKQKQPKAFLVGFKLLVDSTKKELVDAAKKSIKDNKCDIVVANDLRDIQNDDHTLRIVERGNVKKSFEVSKKSCGSNGVTLAEFLVDQILLSHKLKEKFSK